MAGIFGGFRPDNTLGALFLTPPKGNEAHWRRTLANQGSISKARPSLAGKLESATASTLRKAGVPARHASRLGSKTFAAVNDFTPLGNATMAADAGDAFRGGHPLQGLGYATFAVLPGAAGKIGKGMFGGIRAWHGSPHDFDKFSLDKIGTGEGAQAYGHGLYFTADRDTAMGYRERLAGRGEPTKRLRIGEQIFTDDLTRSRATSPAEFAANAVMRFDGDIDYAIDWLREGFGADKEAAKWLRANRNSVGRIEGSPGRLYEVGIKADPESFLDWDRGGADTYLRMSGGRYADPDTSAALLRDGVPGIKYFEPVNRSHDYVVFDDSLIDILNKY